MNNYTVGKLYIRKRLNVFSNKESVIAFIYLGTQYSNKDYCLIRVIYDTAKIFRCGNEVVLSLDSLL